MNNKAIVLILILCFVLPSYASCCTLALHDWQLLAYAKLSVSFPVIPFAEMNTAIKRIENEPSALYWVSSHSIYSMFVSSLLPGIFRTKTFSDEATQLVETSEQPVPSQNTSKVFWPKRLPWIPIDKSKSVMRLANSTNKKGVRALVIGSDDFNLKVALFSDKNSDFTCHQIVIMQQNRIRAVHLDEQSPWAQESAATSYLSCVFYKVPIPGFLLSMSLYPIANAQVALIENEALVMQLFDNNILLPRPISDTDPTSEVIPEMPE